MTHQHNSGVLHQPPRVHKIANDIDMGEQALEVGRCTPSVFKSCLPSGPMQSGSICTVSQHAQGLTNSQAGGSDNLEHLWQHGSQSVVEYGSHTGQKQMFLRQDSLM